jgi:hypothetical protein
VPEVGAPQDPETVWITLAEGTRSPSDNHMKKKTKSGSHVNPGQNGQGHDAIV